MSGSYAHLASVSGTPTGQGIRSLLQSGPTTPGDQPTHSGALCSISALTRIVAVKNHFKTSTRWASPPLSLYSQIELNLIILLGTYNQSAISKMLMAWLENRCFPKIQKFWLLPIFFTSDTTTTDPTSCDIEFEIARNTRNNSLLIADSKCSQHRPKRWMNYSPPSRSKSDFLQWFPRIEQQQPS